MCWEKENWDDDKIFFKVTQSPDVVHEKGTNIPNSLQKILKSAI